MKYFVNRKGGESIVGGLKQETFCSRDDNTEKGRVDSRSTRQGQIVESRLD